MNAIDVIIYSIGFVAVVWWVFGVILLCFAKAYVSPGAPLGVKLMAVWNAGVHNPWILFKYGTIPVVLLHPADPDPAEKAKIDAFMQSLCDCPKCRARRGED